MIHNYIIFDLWFKIEDGKKGQCRKNSVSWATPSNLNSHPSMALTTPDHLNEVNLMKLLKYAKNSHKQILEEKVKNLPIRENDVDIESVLTRINLQI